MEEIQSILREHNASAIRTDYENGKPISVSFMVKTYRGEKAFRLPAETEPVYQVLCSQIRGWSSAWGTQKANHQAQAERVAWRILKDWVRAQMAIIEVGMVTLDEVFMPYMMMGNGQTLYQVVMSGGLALPEGHSGS